MQKQGRNGKILKRWRQNNPTGRSARDKRGLERERGDGSTTFSVCVCVCEGNGGGNNNNGSSSSTHTNKARVRQEMKRVKEHAPARAGGGDRVRRGKEAKRHWHEEGR